MNEFGIFLIFDEIMIGFGCMGFMFVCEGVDVVLDIIILLKVFMGGMLFLLVVIFNEWVSDVFINDCFDSVLMYGFMFMGYVLGCVVVYVFFDFFE